MSLFMLGCAAGIFMAPNNKLIMSAAPADQQGMASGVYKTVLGMGGVIGLAISPAILMRSIFAAAKQANIAIDAVKNYPDILMKGFHSVFVFGALVSVLALAFSWLAKDAPRSGLALTNGRSDDILK